MKQAFTTWEPSHKSTKALLVHAYRIVDEYAAQGYQLTLRQLYYQMVARDIIPNAQNWYKRLGDVVTKARMSGYIDWDAIVDRGRESHKPPQWSSPADIMEAAAQSYRRDRWINQPNYVEVWCEKDALSSVLEPIADDLHVRYLACRGYASTTAIYDAQKRVAEAHYDDGTGCPYHLSRRSRSVRHGHEPGHREPS